MLAYVATTYTLHPAGIENAFIDASKAAAALLRKGFAVFSPVAHTHPIAVYGGINPLDHAIWLPFDEHMMKVADELFVIHMDGWEQSHGIAHEMKFFERAGKPIRHFSWPELEEIAP